MKKITENKKQFTVLNSKNMKAIVGGDGNTPVVPKEEPKRITEVAPVLIGGF
ncbi:MULTISPECIES: hypothetical protein [Chryseobacterium]|uniref:Uncharacterized protein n=1 Tax=Chryseobacterium populi TaxID=1144316 RepID=J3CM22_9FLAO|nr:hypothetical protein [Chryseobacterium populi]EJL74261.1 hypothetical protein PMI13_00994 [Chryseobacterium populi]